MDASRCRTERVNRLSIAPPFPLPSFHLITRKGSLSLYWSAWEKTVHVLVLHRALDFIVPLVAIPWLKITMGFSTSSLSPIGKSLQDVGAEENMSK